MQILQSLFTRKNKTISVDKEAVLVENKVAAYYDRVKSFIGNYGDYLNSTRGGDIDFFFNGLTLLPYQAFALYQCVAPFSISVDNINDELENIPPLIKDTDGKFQNESPILDLLNNPDGDLTINEFIRRIGSDYKITGESYIVALGNISRPPVGLQVIDPREVSVNEDGRSNKPTSYEVLQSHGNSMTFKRRLVNGKDRYIEDGGDREIWIIRNYNPDNRNRGMPFIQGVFPEIEQYMQSSVHNLSILKKGGRPFLFLVFNELFQNDLAQLEVQMKKFVEGANNAGGSMIAPVGVDVKEAKTSNRDMDFALLKDNVTIFIYNKFRIPLPLVMPGRQTMDNVAQSREMLYDNAVIPLANRIYTELTNFLVPRFTKDKIKISFNIKDIPALKGRMLDEQKKIKDLFVTTKNEIRNNLGLEDEPGGDVIYIPSSEVPLGSERPVSNTDKSFPSPDRQELIFKAQKDVKGNRIWTDKEIEGLIRNDG